MNYYIWFIYKYIEKNTREKDIDQGIKRCRKRNKGRANKEISKERG